MIPVCILTAGKGSRLEELGLPLNKALLPVGGKAAVTRIIEKFPTNTPFVIGLGHRGDQVENYLSLAHPDIAFQFVWIDNYDGPNSGPGESLLQCKRQLPGPFYFVSCDTLWTDPLPVPGKADWLAVAPIPTGTSQQFCTIRSEHGIATDLKTKQSVDESAYAAFTGLCYIYHVELFWQTLENTGLEAGEAQMTSGLKTLVEQTKAHTQTINWTDIGSVESYRQANAAYEDFDFSKTAETIYLLDKRVVKFFADPEITRNRVAKSKIVPDAFPAIDGERDQFYSYPYAPGETLYQYNSPRLFQKLLAWLEQTLWKPINAEKQHFANCCQAFYRDKTNQRFQAYLKKHDHLDQPSVINGKLVPSASQLLEQIPWDRLLAGEARFFHGDLQFDNILYNPKSDSFVLLDWRQDFGGVAEFGDLYYDYAKLYGGILLNYDYVKRNLIEYHEDNEGVFFDFAQRRQAPAYLEVLSNYITSQGHDLEKTKLLVGVIFLNMAPLHHYPFDKMLYNLSREFLDQTLNG